MDRAGLGAFADRNGAVIQHSLLLFAHRPSDRKMQRVAMCGVVKRRRPILAKCRQLRRELGLSPDARLNSQRPIAWVRDNRL